jgi:UrcA family protein
MSSHKTFRVARYVAFSAIATLGFGVAAHAGDAATATGAKETVIRYSDLDLSQDADVRTLYSRLQRASNRVCDLNQDGRDLRAKRLYQACYQDTLGRAVDNVGHAAVKAMYASDDKIRVAGRGVKGQAST